MAQARKQKECAAKKCHAVRGNGRDAKQTKNESQYNMSMHRGGAVAALKSPEEENLTKLLVGTGERVVRSDARIDVC